MTSNPLSQTHQLEDEDAANIGRALMERLPEGYSWMSCPTEIVTDLQNEVFDLKREVEPFLRAHAKSCEGCEGSGEIVSGPDDESATSEPCKHCKPLWDLIERIKPPSPAPAPQPSTTEVDDDIPF